MKAIDKLTDKERLMLVGFYETDTFKVLKKLLEEMRLNIAKNTTEMTTTPDAAYGDLRFMQGEAKSLKDLYRILRELYKEAQANEQKKLKD
jgi:hypothetical protein